LSLAEASRRNAEALRAMGMAGRLSVRWLSSNAKYMDAQQAASDVAGSLGAVSRVLRMVLQSGVLAVGAYLVINQEATGGIIVASSILTSRALAPVELAIAHWKHFLGARQSWGRLSDLIGRWQSPLARLTGLSPALLQKIADGSRSVTDDVDGKVAHELAREADRIREVAQKLDEIALRILRNIKLGE
jgi:ABC-type protease/lipase transport system fused ATPase/permease subunit